MRGAAVAVFGVVPLCLLVLYIFIFHFFGILKKKARTEREKNCIRDLLSPRRNPLLTKEEVETLRGIDPRAFKGFQTARLIGVGIVFLGIVLIVLGALLEMRNA